MKTFLALIGWLIIMGGAIFWLVTTNQNEMAPWIVGIIGGLGLCFIIPNKKKEG